MNESVTMFPFEYTLDHDGLEIFCGSLLLRQIPYEDIEGVSAGFSLLAMNWCNLLPFQFITLRLNKGVVRQIVLNPPDRQDFMLEIEERRVASSMLRNRALVPA